MKSGPLTRLAILSYALPFQVPGSQKDRQLLHYFCVQAAYDLSGCVNPNFWCRVVLQRCHSHTVVRQAVVALSSLHLENAKASTSNNGNSSATHEADETTVLQYSRALRALQRYLGQQLSEGVQGQDQVSLTVVLVCCATLYCFESMRGNVEAAIIHLEMGLAIIKRRQDQADTSQRAGREVEDMKELENMFRRLDLQVKFYSTMRPPLLGTTSIGDRPGAAPYVLPDTFGSLSNAQEALNKL